MTVSQDARRAAPPLRIFPTMLHLTLTGTLGWAVIGSLIGWFGAGIGLLFALGIGVFVLAGLVYGLFGVAWFETARVSGLYRLDLPAPRMAERHREGFSGWMLRLWTQLQDIRMWWALAHFTLATVLGSLFVFTAQSCFWSIAQSIDPGLRFGSSVFGVALPESVLSGTAGRAAGVVGIVLSLGLAAGIALLHRMLSISLIGSWTREAELTARADAAAQQARAEAANAAHSAARARESAEQRAGAVRAADLERTRIERDLHDGVQPRLVSVGMTLGLAQQQIDSDPEAAKALLAEAHTSTKAAITELRQLARGIHASVLDDRGLDAALSALASRSHIPVTLDVRMTGSENGRVARAAETAVYFVIAECLTNAAKHSRAGSCRVTVRVRDAGTQTDGSAPAPSAGQVLWARVEDDGVGGAQVHPGGGLDGITNRVRAAGGTVRIDSPVGGPTAVEVSVPCAS